MAAVAIDVQSASITTVAIAVRVDSQWWCRLRPIDAPGWELLPRAACDRLNPMEAQEAALETGAGKGKHSQLFSGPAWLALRL